MVKQRTVKIMAVDPGGKTGVSVGTFPVMRGEFPKTVYGLGTNLTDREFEGDFVEQAKQIQQWAYVDHVQVLVIEKFTLRPGQGFAADLTSVEICAALQALVGETFRHRIVWQTPSEAKGFVTDQRLREFGAWYVGSDHIRDSRRHLIKAMTRYCCEAGDIEGGMTPKQLATFQARQATHRAAVED